jgi:hypothetical protein
VTSAWRRGRALGGGGLGVSGGAILAASLTSWGVPVAVMGRTCARAGSGPDIRTGVT